MSGPILGLAGSMSTAMPWRSSSWVQIGPTEAMTTPSAQLESGSRSPSSSAIWRMWLHCGAALGEPSHTVAQWREIFGQSPAVDRYRQNLGTATLESVVELLVGTAVLLDRHPLAGDVTESIDHAEQLDPGVGLGNGIIGVESELAQGGARLRAAHDHRRRREQVADALAIALGFEDVEQGAAPDAGEEDDDVDRRGLEIAEEAAGFRGCAERDLAHRRCRHRGAAGVGDELGDLLGAPALEGQKSHSFEWSGGHASDHERPKVSRQLGSASLGSWVALWW